MHNVTRAIAAVSPVRLLGGVALVAAVVYVALIAFVMSYAAVTVEFAQSVRNDEAEVAKLEATYLAAVASITSSDYASAGYAKPIAQTFVAGAPATALR